VGTVYPQTSTQLNLVFDPYSDTTSRGRARAPVGPANIQVTVGRTWGTYTITLAGLDWLDEGFPWPSGAPQTPAADMARAEHRPDGEEAQEGAESP
jgi:hypothetical protein